MGRLTFPPRDYCTEEPSHPATGRGGSFGLLTHGSACLQVHESAARTAAKQ